jgi:hypothetical protein
MLYLHTLTRLCVRSASEYNHLVLIGACTVRLGSGIDTIAVAMNFLVVD